MPLTKQLATVVVARCRDFEHTASHLGAEAAVAQLADLRLDLLAAAETNGGLQLAADPMCANFRFANPDEAVDLALYAASNGLVVGVDCGELHVDEGLDAWGLAVARAIELAATGQPGEVACSNELLQQLKLPDGIGVFRAPEAREALVGHATHMLRDYR